MECGYAILMCFHLRNGYGNVTPLSRLGNKFGLYPLLCSAKPSSFTNKNCAPKPLQINVCLWLLYQFPDFLSTYLAAFIKELCATNFYDVLSSRSGRPLHSKQTLHGHYMCVSSPVMSAGRYEQVSRYNCSFSSCTFNTLIHINILNNTYLFSPSDMCAVTIGRIGN